MDDFDRLTEKDPAPPHCWTWLGRRRKNGWPIMKTPHGWVQLGADRLRCHTLWCVNPDHADEEE